MDSSKVLAPNFGGGSATHMTRNLASSAKVEASMASSFGAFSSELLLVGWFAGEGRIQLAN